MNMAWMRTVCGRPKSDYNYSITVVYNDFAFPLNVSDSDKKNIENLSHAVFDARALYPNATLADLYDPLTMPIELIKAHKDLDKAVDKAYGYKGNLDDASRVAFMFKLYEQLTSILPSQPINKTRTKK
jgi:hypothetical protein